MKDNSSMISSNTNQSIRTNYNNYKRKKIKRNNSRPDISRTKEFFNYQIGENNQNTPNINYNYNYNYINQNQQTENSSMNNNVNKENYWKYYQTEETQSSEYKNREIGRRGIYPNTKRVIDANYQEAPKMKKQLNNDNKPKDDWADMLYHPINNVYYNNNKRMEISKTYESNVFSKEENPAEKIRHNKETKYSDRLHKTQITTLPGCIKRGKYDIKDDKNFNIRNTESHLYKMEYDYSSNVHFGPLTKEEEKIQNNFPREQRYQGSYQRGVKDNDIFNLKNRNNKYNYGKYNYGDDNEEEEEEEKVKYKGKKMFKDNNTFKSQIQFV